LSTLLNKIFPNNHIYFDNKKIIFYNCVIEEVIALANFAERMRSLRKEKGLKKMDIIKIKPPPSGRGI